VNNWRQILSWQLAPSFDQIIKSLNIPAPKSTVAPMSQEDKDLLYEYNFDYASNIKSTWIYRILNKVKNNEPGSILIEEEGFSRVKMALQEGLLNLNNGVISLSTKGEHLWELINTRLLPAKDTEKYTEQYFNKLIKVVGNALLQAEPTDIIIFWRTPKKKWDTWYLGKLNNKVIQYIKQFEKNLHDTFGVNITKLHGWDIEELSIIIIQEALRDTGGYGEDQNNKILDYVRGLYPRKNIEYIVLESDGELAGHSRERNSSLNFSWQVQPDTPSVVHHRSMADDKLHHVDDQGYLNDISHDEFTSDWKKVTCNDCKYGRIQDTLYFKHDREARRKRAEFYNFGWATTDYGIASKTSRGIFESEIDPETLIVTHFWNEEDE